MSDTTSNKETAASIVQVGAMQLPNGKYRYTGFDVKGNAIPLLKASTRLFDYVFIYDQPFNGNASNCPNQFCTYGKHPPSNYRENLVKRIAVTEGLA